MSESQNEAVKAQETPAEAAEPIKTESADAVPEIKPTETENPASEEAKSAPRAPAKKRLTRDTPKAPAAKAAPVKPAGKEGAKTARTARKEAARRNRIEQVEVVITGGEGSKPAVVELRPYRNTRVVRRGPESRSKFVLKYSITLDTLPAQNLLERNFEHVSWSAEQLANYIARNRNVADVTEFENAIDNESSKIDEKLSEGLMMFTGYLKDAGIDPKSFAEGSGWTRPVTFHLTIESNTAMRFVKLVSKFDELCRILDVMHVFDQLGNGATVRHRSEVEKWRNLVNSLARIVISSQHKANDMISENRLPNATPDKNRPALTSAAAEAKEEEKAFEKTSLPQLEMKPEDSPTKVDENTVEGSAVEKSDEAAGKEPQAE